LPGAQPSAQPTVSRPGLPPEQRRQGHPNRSPAAAVCPARRRRSVGSQDQSAARRSHGLEPLAARVRGPAQPGAKDLKRASPRAQGRCRSRTRSRMARRIGGTCLRASGDFVYVTSQRQNTRTATTINTTAAAAVIAKATTKPTTLASSGRSSPLMSYV